MESLATNLRALPVQPVQSHKLAPPSPVRLMGSAENQDPDRDRLPELQDLVRRQLALLGEDPDREGLLKTPERVARSLLWLTRGGTVDVADVVGDAVFEEEHESMMMRGVEKQNSRTITSALRGQFRECPVTRDEFLRLAHRG
jgi:GTP cyclohydrolase I